MEKSVYRIALDMHKDASQYSLHAKRYDTARTIRATFMDGGKPFDVSGFYPILTGRNAVGETLYESCKISDNSVVYDFTATLTGIPGLVECEIQLYNQDPKQGGAVMITSARFSVIVAEAVYQEGDPKAEANREAFTQLLSDTTAAMGAANAAAEEVLRRADSGEFDGAPGAPGGKGEKGDKGDKGDPGKVTEEDKIFIENNVIKQIGIIRDVDGELLVAKDASNCRLQAFTVTGGTAGEDVSIVICGKNLFDSSKVNSNIKVEGAKITISGGGLSKDFYTGAANGAGSPVAVTDLDKLPILPAGTYNISYIKIAPKDSGYIRVEKVADDGSVTLLNSSSSKVFTLAQASRITLRRSVSAEMIVEDVQIEPGTVATSYTPYTAQQAVVKATGGTVDVLVDNPSLHSYKPATTITNDKSLPMKAAYVADMETYINNAVADLAANLIAN